jgi:hypothetical protein
MSVALVTFLLLTALCVRGEVIGGLPTVIIHAPPTSLDKAPSRLQAGSKRSVEAAPMVGECFHRELEARVGFHPLLLPLVLGWTYDVRSVGASPEHPTRQVTISLVVELEQEAILGDASRVMRLRIAEGPNIDDMYGTRQHMADAIPPERRWPLFFVKRANGSLVDLYHHPKDDDESVDMKRMLAGSLQLVTPTPSVPRLRPPSEYATTEADHHGPADAT